MVVDEFLRALLATMASAPSQVLQQHLLDPAKDFQDRPSKKYRRALVFLGARLVSTTRTSDLASDAQLEVLSNSVELLHSASLILDDIQDGGTSRRGRPAYSVSASLAESLNLAGWLSWYPMCLVSTCKLPVAQEVMVLRVFNESVAKAYAGQALDVSTDIREVAQDDVYESYLSTATLKTGSVTAASLAVGAIAAGAPPELVREIVTLGEQLGVLLQIFDDIGNFSGRKEPSKKFEDMVNRVPSWIWAAASQHLDARDYAAALGAIGALPDTRPLEAANESYQLLEEAERRGALYLGQINDTLDRFVRTYELDSTARDEFARIIQAISRDYR